MNDSSSAIILKTIKYGDTSLIVHAYTKEYGKLAFMVKGARKPKAKLKANMLQSMNLVEMEFKRNSKSDLHILTELRLHYIFDSLQVDMAKTALAIYLLEIFSRSIGQENAQPSLFEFVKDYLIALDHSETYENWHFYFLLECSRYLGFYPDNNYSEQKCHFDPSLGIFSDLNAVGYQLDEKSSLFLSQLLFSSLSEIHTVEMTGSERLQLLNELETFYKTHLPSFGDVRSLDVYRVVFAG